MSEGFHAISIDERYVPRKTPVRVPDFWDADEYDLNKYEEWAATACICFKPICSCCCHPGTLDSLACCLPVNCCNGWHKCFFKCKCCSCFERLLSTTLLLPCLVVAGPLFVAYHNYRLCCGKEHRYYRTVDHQDHIDANNCGHFDCNGENVCLGCEECAN